jgi:type II secretory pathway pseudopilin PulG
MQAVRAYLSHCFSSVSERGQILLVIVLVMIVALTIGLSVVTRSVTNLQITSEEESSQRALSAAEAGIEKALQSGKGSSTAVDLKNNSKIDNISVNDISGTSLLVNGGNVVLKDDGGDVWLAPHDAAPSYQPAYDGAMTVSWGNPSERCLNGPSNSAAALEILIIGQRASGGKVLQTYPFDPCNASTDFNRVSANGFCTDTTPVSATCPSMQKQTHTVNGKQFAYRVTLPVTDGILARMVPLYASTPIAVTSDRELPSQGVVIESLGSSGNTQRKISVYRGYGKIPVEFFPYGLFSP